MSQPTTSTQSPNTFAPSVLLCGSLTSGATGAIAGALFTPIGAVGGAIFGVSNFLSGRLIQWVCEKTNLCPENTLAKVAICALSTIGGIAAAVLITTAVGFPMTLLSGAFLAVASLGVALTTALVFGGCLCCGALATGAIIAGNDPQDVRV